MADDNRSRMMKRNEDKKKMLMLLDLGLPSFDTIIRGGSMICQRGVGGGPWRARGA